MVKTFLFNCKFEQVLFKLKKRFQSLIFDFISGSKVDHHKFKETIIYLLILVQC